MAAWPSSAPRLVCASVRPASSAMSAPAQNALSPAPVTSSARASLAAAWSMARDRSSTSLNDSAFSACGRLRRMSANSPTRCSSMAMSMLLHGFAPAHRLRRDAPDSHPLLQLALQDLAARGEREGLQGDEVLGHVVFRQARRVQVVEQPLAADVLALAADDRDAHLLAEA